jgi:methionyl-tRNA formyltransferase
MFTKKAIFMGSPAFAVPALQSLMSNQYDIIAVYTQPDKRTGRGQQLMPCSVKQFAVSHGLRVIQPETFKNAEEISTLEELQPDIIIVAAYGQILPDSVLHIPKYNCINIHPSLLPKYRGPAPVAAAILNGDAVTGVTVMLIERKVDSGPVLSQKKVPVPEEATTESLTEMLANVGAELLIETIPWWINGKVEPHMQDETLASFTRMETKENGRLDWKLPAVQLWRRVRAYYPWPGCFTGWKGVRLKIIKAVPLNEVKAGKVGEVVLPRTGEARAAVQTADGLLGLNIVQLEGKREMSAGDFMAGHRDFIGSILT